MAKNILIFSDGTGQVGGLRPDQRLSNIYKLYRATRVGPDSPIDPANQTAFYDPGLGTDELGVPWWVAPISAIRKAYASATGTGITRNLIDCYAEIIARYNEGDRIYLFGFSRGAYTARCLANIVALCGVPITDDDGSPVPKQGPRLRAIATEAVEGVYNHAVGRNWRKYEDEQQELARRFQSRFGSGSGSSPDCPNVAPYFVGVFDTVAALGVRWWTRWGAVLLAAFGVVLLCRLSAHLIVPILNRPALWLFGQDIENVTMFGWYFSGAVIALLAITTLRQSLKIIRDFPTKGQTSWHLSLWNFNRKESDTRLNKHVRFARHALAIDERRWDFGRARWGSADTDIEGTTPNVMRLLQVWFPGNHSDVGGSYPEDESRLSDISLGWMLKQAKGLPDPILIDDSKLVIHPRADGMQHCEVIAFQQKFPAWWPKALRFAWKTDARLSASDAPHHPSVKERFDLPAIQNMDRTEPYRPVSLALDKNFGEACRTANEGCLPKNFANLLAETEAARAAAASKSSELCSSCGLT